VLADHPQTKEFEEQCQVWQQKLKEYEKLTSQAYALVAKNEQEYNEKSVFIIVFC
jgi:hypothetical protein